MGNIIKDINSKASIEKCITAESKTIYVVKGFGERDYESFGLEKLMELSTEDYLAESFDITKTAMLPVKMISGAPYILSYEDFLPLADTLIPFTKVYSYTIKVIDNNLFHIYYPIAERFTNTDLFADIDKNKENVLTTIYDEYLNVEDEIMVSYRAFKDYTDVEYINVYNISELELNKERFETQFSTSFGMSDENFAVGLLEVLKNPDKVFDITIDENNLPDYQVDSAKILLHLGYKVNLTKRELEPVEKASYPEYEAILKRKNSAYSFRDIAFYKNPGYSLETVDVSQGEIVDALVKNAELAQAGEKYNDIFVTAPTGSGKSVLFQIPAIYLAEKSKLLTIVVSPLIGLMNDQIQNIQSMTQEAATINSEYTPEEKDKIKQDIRDGKISIIYVSPETLLSNNPIENLIGDNRKIGLLVIDESHIVTTWGKSFRPDYWFLGDYISNLRIKQNKKFPIATFSATVTYGGNDDMHGDIIDSLKMKTGDYEYIAPMRRDDIEFDINLCEKENDYQKEKDNTVHESLQRLIDYNKKTVAYFPFTSQVNSYDKDFSEQGARRYHGGLNKMEKDEALESFKNGSSKLILATKAFGMGIDIDDIDVVYHYAPTGNLCDYVQEIGRAARKPGVIGTAEVDFYENDYKYINQLFGMSSIKNFHITEVLKKIRDIYLAKKRRNFIVSSEEFAYIFSNGSTFGKADVDVRFKTTLLMIQKDFERMPYINFKPIVFKPRSMFSRGFFMVTDDMKNTFERSSYRKYFKLYATKEDMASKFIDKREYEYTDWYSGEVVHKTSLAPLTVTYRGDVYIAYLKQMWEENFIDMSFAAFKYMFYKGELDGASWTKDLKPEFIMTLVPKVVNFERMYAKFEKILTEIDKRFSLSDIDRANFKIEDIAAVIESTDELGFNHYDSIIAANNLVEIMNNFNSTSKFSAGYVFKYNASNERYSLISINSFRKKISDFKYQCKKMFGSVMNANRKVFLIGQKKALDHKSNEVMMAQLLETFKLATYEVTSGDIPEYFIRVNSVTAIEKILDTTDYESEMVKLVRFRHEESKRIMTYFFTELNDDKERWDYIERYFAGVEV